MDKIRPAELEKMAKMLHFSSNLTLVYVEVRLIFTIFELNEPKAHKNLLQKADNVNFGAF